MRYKINPKYELYTSQLLDIESLFKLSDDIVYQKRNSIKNISFEGNFWNVKSFAVPNILNRVIYSLFRDSKAKRSFEYSIKIAPFVPVPLGYIEFYSSALIKNSYFISKRFEYDFTIREILFDEIDSQKRDLLEEFARFSYSLHQEGIEHLDYSPGNILIKRDNSRYIFKIVDINRMRFRELDMDSRAKNFARVWLRDEDLKIIIKEYCRVSNYSYEEMIPLAIAYSQKHKDRGNFKKRLKSKLLPITSHKPLKLL
jgi:serine/threonine protein kinase